jgi:predicted nucleic acid-binding protein
MDSVALLDTSFIVDLPHQASGAQKVLRELHSREMKFCVAAITITELWLGVLHKSPADQRYLQELLSRVTILPFTDETARRTAELLSSQRSEGFTVDLQDAMIAATALEHGETIVTKDRIFTTIPGLRTLTY